MIRMALLAFAAINGMFAVWLLGAGTPAQISAPVPTEPPVLIHPPLTPKGTTITPPPSAAVPSYTAQQARAGQTLFYEHCAECHGSAGEGNWAPPLLVPTANIQWQPVYYVYSYMTEHMPAGNAMALKQVEYIDLMAFVLKSHGHPAGSASLTDTTLKNSRALVGLEQP